MILRPEQHVQLTALRQAEIWRQVVGEHIIRQAWWMRAAVAVAQHP